MPKAQIYYPLLENNPKITVVIPTHKDFRKVSKAVDSLLNQTLKPFEIIIIDNNSEENIYKKVKNKYKSKIIKPLRLERNSGVTGGRNAGILRSSKESQYIFFFDHDMIADEGMLQELYTTLKEQDAGISTPKIFYKKEKNIIWAAGTDINLLSGQVLFRSGRDVGQYNYDVQVAIAPAAILVDKKVIEKIGGFDNRYFATYEDSDFCFRASRAGYKVFYSSKAVAYHDLERSVEQDAERLIGRAYWVARNRILFMADYSKSFLVFLLFSPIYASYYFLLALRTNQVSKFFTEYLRGLCAGLFEVVSHRYSQYIPYSYHWILRKQMGFPRTILDVGSGDGLLLKDIVNKKTKVVGLEIFDESVLLSKVAGIYNKVIKADVTKLDKLIKQKYDLVFSSQVVEHLDKKKALQSIKVWESFAKNKIVITTTNGFIDFNPIEDKEDLNPYQKHKSGWSQKDFEEIGFDVYGQGLKFIYGESGLARKFPKLLIFWSTVSLLLAPFAYYFPNRSMYLVASKEI